MRKSTASLLAAGLCVWVWGCASEPGLGSKSAWEREMQSAVTAFELGDPAASAAHFEQALAHARENPLNPHEQAYAAWHLGDVCFKQPDVCPPGDAERRTREALAIFAAHQGSEHPVVIPVLLRLGEIRDGQGDKEAAKELREKADRITAQAFPESHYLRSRLGTHRPASDLHPQELLRILAEVDPLGG